MDDHTLIALPQEKSMPAGRRWVAWGLLAINGAILLGTLVVDWAFPVTPPQPVGIEKTQDDERRAQAKWSDGSRASLIEHDYRQTSRVRKELSKPYTEWLFRTFGEGGSSVLVGKDGMLFLRDRIEVPETHFRIGAQRTAVIYAAVSRRLEALGIRMVVAPVPRKSVVCADWLPPGWHANRQYDEIVLEEFERRGVFTVDLLTALEPHAGEAFLRMDTHWSTQGMRESAIALGHKTGWMKPEEERYGMLREVPAPTTAPLGDLTLAMGVEFRESDAPKYQRPMWEVILPNGQPLPQGDLQANIVLCGTSFSQHGTFGSFLAHYLGQSVQTYSIPGAPPYAALATMFRERLPERLPHIVIEEVPNHHVISAGYHSERWAVNPFAAEIFAQYPAPHQMLLPMPKQAWQTSAELGTELHAVGGRVILDVDSGWVAHTGGGVVELRLQGQVVEGEVRIDVHSDQGTLSAPWPAGATEMQLPVFTQTPGSRPLRVVLATLTPEARFVLEHAEFRMIGREDLALEGLLTDRIEHEQGSLQAIHFAPDVTVPAHGTLVVDTESLRPTAKQVRVILPSTTDEPDWVIPLGDLRPGAKIVLDLGALHGQPLPQVQVVWEGQKNQPIPVLVTDARLVPLR